MQSGYALPRSWVRVGHRPRAALITQTQGQCLSLASAWEVGGSTPLGRRGSLPPLDDLNGARPPLENPRPLTLTPPARAPRHRSHGCMCALPRAQAWVRGTQQSGKVPGGLRQRHAGGRAVAAAVAAARVATFGRLAEVATTLHTFVYGMNCSV